MISFLGAVRVRHVGEDEWTHYDREGLTFFNVNTEDDLKEAGLLLQ